MRIYIHNTFTKLDESVRSRISNQVELALKKFDSHIMRTTIQLIDINGPKGGRDKSCRLEIRLLPTGTIFVEDTGIELYESVDIALNKASNAISRAIQRQRGRHRALAA